MLGSCRNRGRSGWTAALLLVALAAGAGGARGDEAPTYERDIRPLFARRCNVCHSKKNLDNADVSAGLALDSYEAALAGTVDHRVVTAGDAAASSLYQRLGDPDEERRMPLAEKPLTSQQRDLVRRWIDAGAPRGVALAASNLPARPGPVRATRRVVRTLDVVVPLEAKAPSGLEGVGTNAGGPMQLVLQVGPLPAITALAFPSYGRQLAVGTSGAVVIWDLDAAKPALILGDIPGAVHALALQRDGTHLAVGSGLPARSGSVRVYALPEGALVNDYAGHDDVVSGLDFSPDGRWLASSSFDQTVRLWELGAVGDKEGSAGLPPPGVFHGHSDFVSDVAFTADGVSLLTVSKDRSIKRTEVATLKERRTYSDHNDDVLALAVHPQGKRFVTAGNEPQIRWWELEGEKPTMKVTGHAGPVHQLVYSVDGKRLVSAGADGGVRLWDGMTGVLLRTLPGATEWQYAAALTGDGRRAAAGGWDGLVRVWDAEAGKLLATLLQTPAATPAATDWLVALPSGLVAASEPLHPLLRWQVAGKDAEHAAAIALFLKPGEVAEALQDKKSNGEPSR